MKQINTYMIFSNLRRWVLLVTVFSEAKLQQVKLKRIKGICWNSWWSLIVKLNQEGMMKKKKVEYLKGPKVLGPTQMLQRLPVALEKVKAGNASENLLNEIREIIYMFLVSSKRNY